MIHAENYKPVKVSLKCIKRMIKNDTWKDSLVKEELLYNMKYNLYSKAYTWLVKRIIKENVNGIHSIIHG